MFGTFSVNYRTLGKVLQRKIYSGTVARWCIVSHIIYGALDRVNPKPVLLKITLIAIINKNYTL
jgi:hypothetical protein